MHYVPPLATPIVVSFRPCYDMHIEKHHTFLCNRLGITKSPIFPSHFGRWMMRLTGNAPHPLALQLSH